MYSNIEPQRRQLIVGALAGGLAAYASTANGQTPQQQEALKPYLEVKTFPGESRMIRAFFSPSCPFSRQYMAFFTNLAASLPASRTFSLTPVINHKDGMSYALAFETVRLVWPNRLPAFVEASFSAVQDRGLDTSTWSGMAKLVKFAKFDDLLVQVAGHRKEIESVCTRLVSLQAHLKISNTPAVAVVGTYVATPEFTQGNPEMFSALINSIISMSI